MSCPCKALQEPQSTFATLRRGSAEFQNALESAGFKIRCQVIWAKNTFVGLRGVTSSARAAVLRPRGRREDPWYGDKTQSHLWQEAEPPTAFIRPRSRSSLLNARFSTAASPREHRCRLVRRLRIHTNHRLRARAQSPPDGNRSEVCGLRCERCRMHRQAGCFGRRRSRLRGDSSGMQRGGSVNRAMPSRDRGDRSRNSCWQSGSARAVPSAFGLVSELRILERRTRNAARTNPAAQRDESAI